MSQSDKLLLYRRIYRMKKSNFKETEIATVLDLPIGTVHKIIKQLSGKSDSEKPKEELNTTKSSESIDILCIERAKYIILDISGSLVIKNLRTLKDELNQYAENDDTRPIALKLTEVDRIDSSAVGVIINFNKNLLKKNRRLVFLDPSKEIDPILRQLNLYETIPVYGAELILESKLKELVSEDKSRRSKFGGF